MRLMCGLMCGQPASPPPHIENDSFLQVFACWGCCRPPPLHPPPLPRKIKIEKVLGSLCAHQTHINAHQFWRDPCPILEIEATTHPAHPQSGIEAISARMSPSWAKYMLEDLSAALCRAEGVWIEHWSAY